MTALPTETVAALFVQTNGVYFGLPGVDPWDEKRDARKYTGPHPVVAHPPCQRWGRFWHGSTRRPHQYKLGADGGCFASALWAVRTWGGVLEHCADSLAWDYYGLTKPVRYAGWSKADNYGGWTCCVEQGHYGHRARKATWLYACHVDLPELAWGSCGVRERLDDGYHSAEERRRAVRTGVCQRLSARQRAATPIPFRDLLLSMARSVNPSRIAA